MRLSRIPSIIILLLTKVVSGLKEMFTDPLAKLDFDGVEVLVSDLVARFERYLGIYKAVETAEKSRKTAMSKRRPIEPDVERDLLLLREALIPKLGRKNQDLTDFGFDPVKDRRQLTSVENMKKAEKSSLTRKARHTMGKRQKRAIKGDANGGTTNGTSPKPQ